jgi:hypothetical protein
VDRLHEGNYHTLHKPGMKKPKDWRDNNGRHEQPASRSLSKSEPLSKSAVLNGNSRALQQKIGRWKPVTCASGQ